MHTVAEARDILGVRFETNVEPLGVEVLELIADIRVDVPILGRVLQRPLHVVGNGNETTAMAIGPVPHGEEIVGARVTHVSRDRAVMISDVEIANHVVDQVVDIGEHRFS